MPVKEIAQITNSPEWDIFTGEVKKFIIESDHLGMMVSPEAAKQIAKILNKELIETLEVDE